MLVSAAQVPETRIAKLHAATKRPAPRIPAHALFFQNRLSLAAVASNAGLLLVSPGSNAVVTSYAFGAVPVWSVAFGREHDIYAGLQDGRLVRADRRVAGVLVQGPCLG